MDLIEKPETRGVRSFESNAFQLFIERLKRWQRRYRELFESSPDTCLDAFKPCMLVLEQLRRSVDSLSLISK